MSGLGAVLYRDGREIAQSDIERVARALRAYGPERQIAQTHGRIGFAYTHFTNTPEDRGAAQPVSGSDDRFTMIFDGRLDNRDSIATDLAIEASRLKLMPDAALAIASWERWGEDALSRWVGEFAFIVWDQTEMVLKAARDQFGARTLHYSTNANRFVIASAPKGIHALGDLPREIDEQKVADALAELFHDAERTFFKGIRRIPPGGILTVTQTGVSVRKYYRLKDNVQPILYKTDAEYVEAGLELLDQSVRSQLRSAGPVGAFLSGGLDSSSMSALAVPHLAARGKKLISYTSVPESGWDGRDSKGLFGDEGPYVQEIGAMLPDIEVNLIDGAGRGHYDSQEELLLHLEMPVRNALNLQWTHAILEKARARGVSVMLQGTLGNATLTHLGDGVFRDLLKSGDFKHLYRELKALSQSRKQIVDRLFKHVIFPMGPQWLWDAKERLRGRQSKDIMGAKYANIAPDFFAEMRIPDRIRQTGYSQSGGKPGYSRDLWYNFLENWNTDIGDIMQGLRAMYGIEIRDPFADRRVIEWSFGVPEAQFHRGGVNRRLIRRMMDGRLPDSVVRNNKIGHQTADWYVRLSRDLPAMRQDMYQWENDKTLSRMLNLKHMRSLVDNWPDKSIIDSRDERFIQLQVILPRTMQIAQFVHRESSSNQK